MLWLDIETRSQVSLTKHGLARYAMDCSTEVICMAYAFDEGPVACWFSGEGPFPSSVIDHIQTGGKITAHNAAFERALFDYVISNDYNFTPPSLQQWQCSSARAMAHGLPGALGALCQAVSLPQQKMTEGARLIRYYCAPGHLTEWDPGDKELMREYCITDVETMRRVCGLLRELDTYEWEQYHINEQMNDYGVPIDTLFVSSALRYAEAIKEDVTERVQELTNGLVEKPTARKTRDAWLTQHLPQNLLDLITVESKGVVKVKFDKEYRQRLAAHADTPELVKDFIDLVEQSGGSTISKYTSMNNTHVDGRVHGSLIWSGAGATGRYSSRGLQLQNMRRDVLDEPEPVIADICNGQPVERPAETLGRLIRSAIYAPGGLTYSDYSQIEARVLPWLSGDPRAEITLDIFREDRDLYTESAVMFGLAGSTDDVDKDARQAAKIGSLACGFSGGKNAVQAMARVYGLDYDDEKCQDIVRRWRNANPWAQPFWYASVDAVRSAVSHPGNPFTAGRLTFQFNAPWLWLRLPSGRCLAYFDPRFELVEYPWGGEGWEVTALWGAGKPKVGEPWPRRSLSATVIVENATQGAAADIMRETITRAHHAGIRPLFTVHDELVVDGYCAGELVRVMETAPTWAEGLPIKATVETSTRYGK